MSFSLRAFFVESNGEIKKISLTLLNRIIFNEITMPQYAKQRVRVATVFVETEGRRIIRITGNQFGYFIFDASGAYKIDEETCENMFRTNV